MWSGSDKAAESGPLVAAFKNTLPTSFHSLTTLTKESKEGRIEERNERKKEHNFKAVDNDFK